jgi:exodeoxyribonuclease VIII
VELNMTAAEAPTTSVLPVGPGVYEDMSAEAYHGIRAVSATALKMFARKTPAHVKALLDGRLSEETSAMAKGTALHAALLEPGRFETAYRVGPEVNRNTREWKAFAAECDVDGVEPLKPSESADILGMRDAIWADPSIRKLLLASDRRELSIVWRGPHGLMCKARLDLYSTKYGAVLDVKTTTDASIEKFEAGAFRMGYHIQLGWYARAAVEAQLMTRMTGLLAVETKVPFLPCIFQPAADLLARGDEEIRGILPRWARCEESDIWPGYSPDGRPVTLAIPKFAGPTSWEEASDE